jgi:hypothetical protein
MDQLEEIKNRYIDATTIHGGATLSGDYKLGNKQIDIINDAYNILHRTEEGKKILKELMSYPNSGVQLWAATHSLPYVPEEAKKILNEIHSKNDLIGFSAGVTLKEWENGKLKL